MHFGFVTKVVGLVGFDRDDCVQIVLPLAPLCLFVPFVKLLKCGEYLNVGDLKLKCHLKAHSQRQRKAGIFSTDASHSPNGFQFTHRLI